MKINFDELPDPGPRYELGEILGRGVFGKVYEAKDSEANNKNVAIKIQKYDNAMKEFIEREFQILQDMSSIVYLVDFYGIFKKNGEIWFVLEHCEGGPVIDLVNGLLARNRRMSEEHIAYILKEIVKALIYLHENKIMHRDVNSNNILLTKEGEVKLSDFNLSKQLRKMDGRTHECLGSPCWMAPELVVASPEKEECGYDIRVDVWALGITAIELGDGKAPFQDMHPTRSLFQIIKNPPPTLQKLSNWTENYHDFISECLVKNPEYRPYIMEVIEHPFLEQIPENNYHLTLEIKSLLQDIKRMPEKRPIEVSVFEKYLKKSTDEKLELMLEEDLANIGKFSENNVLSLLEKKMNRGENHNFIGDILLVLNPNEKRNIYGEEFHKKYQCKSRSDNAPHIYAIADTAYQNALHHVAPQQIVLSGESGSGKTTNYLHLIDHLFSLGANMSINSSRIQNAIKLIHAMTHASTPVNDYSTRCALRTLVSYGKSGKLSAASFDVYFLEKWRISSVDMNQSNFHMLYYVYDGLVHSDQCEIYNLVASRNYRYFRVLNDGKLKQPKHNIEDNVAKFKRIKTYLKELEFTNEEMNTVFSTIAAILNLGEVRFRENDDGSACLENREYVDQFSDLLEVDSKKMAWALTNYCLIKKENVIRKRNTTDEARDSRDVLANNLYIRLVDYVVALINHKLSLGKALFGEKYKVKLLDYYGFECFKQNHLPQLFVNCLNEQLQYHYLQRVFAWEALDLKDEDVQYELIDYYDNRKTLNQLLSKPEGILSILEDASKRGLGGSYVMDQIQNQESSRVVVSGIQEFSIAHYTGVVAYNSKEMPYKNRDFLPPEIIETMRNSENPIIKALFTNKLDRTGNLIVTFEDDKKSKYTTFKSKIPNSDQYSQIRRMRTSATIFRSLCLNLLKELSVGSGSGGTHFVRCIRADLEQNPFGFNRNLVKQQIRALSVAETAKARQKGYSQRISFSEFLRRYKFLAFDFEENVDVTSDNCRLLLIRLKMEGWAIGKSKVFLKYYNEEYLSRLYETQVRKIIKIQSILRGFLAKCRVAKDIRDKEMECIEEIREVKRRRSSIMTEDEAAEVIQKAYRKSAKRKELMGMFEPLEEEDCNFVRPYANKWRRKSVFWVLCVYRAVRLQDFFNFCQQVHLFNQTAYHNSKQTQDGVDLDLVDRRALVSNWLGEIKPAVLKLRFRLDEIPYYDTSDMCDLLTNVGEYSGRDECWDSPYRWREMQIKAEKEQESNEAEQKNEDPVELTQLPYTRDPDEELPQLSSPPPPPSPPQSPPALFSPLSPVEHKEKKNVDNRAVRETVQFRPKSPIPQQIKDEQVKVSFIPVNLRKTGSQYMYEKENFISNSTPANKDFDYIKAKPITNKPKHVDPVAELKNIARKDSNTSDDDPPFNFQGMLRKTNFQRDSIKKTLEAVRRFSLPKDEDENNEKAAQNKENVYVNGTSYEPIITKQVSMELYPGLIIEGVEVEL